MRKRLKDLRAACNSPFGEKLPHKNRVFRRVTGLPLLFSFAIFRAARAPEDAQSICLSEPLAPIMKFPTRVKISEEKKMSSEVVIICNELPAASTDKQRRYFRLEDIPTCSVGDGDVFYPGNGTEEEPIQID